MMYRCLVSVQVIFFEECLVTIVTFVGLFLIVNFPNVSLEPVGLRKYFATVTAFCGTLCFCIHFRVCSRWWRHTPGVSINVLLLVSTVQVVTLTISQALIIWL